MKLEIHRALVAQRLWIESLRQKNRSIKPIILTLLQVEVPIIWSYPSYNVEEKAQNILKIRHPARIWGDII